MGIATSYISYKQIIKAVEQTLAQAREVKRSESLETATESLPDLPLLMVYARTGDTDISSTRGAQTTYSGGVRQSGLTIFADVAVRQRSNIGEDMLLTMDMVDALVTILEAEDQQPYFDQPGIKGLHWTWEQMTFKYGDPEASFVGVRFTIELTIF